MKMINIVLAILFALFAIAQYNDPDPALWILVYGYTALLCLLSYFGKINKLYIWTGIFAIGMLMVTRLPGVYEWIMASEKSEIIGKMYKQKPYIEETREFGGLLAALLAIIFNARNQKK